MILAAKKSGADSVKFQLWNPMKLKPGPWDKDGRRKIYERSYLDYKKFKLLYNFSKKNKIDCFASIFSADEILLHKKVNSKIVKIPSHESYNIKIIDECVKNFEYVLISLGALKKDELIKILKIVKQKKNLIPLHCVSAYPLNAEDTNFYKMNYISNYSKLFGYSGHMDSINDAIYAINNGAKIIEKHFTINKNLEGRDNKFALLPMQFKILRDFADCFYDFKTKRTLDIQKCELDIFKNYRGRWTKESS